MSELLGTVIDGRFEVVRAIGKGGYGDVFQAVQLSVDRQVALKVVHRHLAERTDVSQRFRREARLTSRLDHPNAVRVIDFGDDAGLLYLVMDFVQGPTLKEHLKEHGPVSPAFAAEIVQGIASALHGAHSIGLVHRDLKPSNIILTADAGGTRPVVIDFGLVKVFSEEPSTEDVTASHMMIGTPAYMSPENVLGKPVDGRSDLYAVGVLLFEMLTGERPFHGETQLELATNRLHAPAPSIGPSHPASLRELVADLLERDPDDRVASAEELVTRLKSRPVAGSTPTTLVDTDHTVAPVRGPGASRPAPANNDGNPVLEAPGTVRAQPAKRPSVIPRVLLAAALVVASLGIIMGTAGDPPAEPRPPGIAESDQPETSELEPEAERITEAIVAAREPTEGSSDSVASLPAPDLSPAESPDSDPIAAEPDELHRAERIEDDERSRDRRESAEPGTLVVNASPFAAVYVDGELVDEDTPADLSLPAGEYEVSTRYLGPAMTEPSVLSETVRVRPGRSVAITHRHD